MDGDTEVVDKLSEIDMLRVQLQLEREQRLAATRTALMAQLQRDYRLGEADAIDAATGTITRR